MKALAPALLLLSGCVAAHPGPKLVDEMPTGRRAGGLELRLTQHPDGGPWRLSEYRGHVVLLDVWATWCDPCRDSLPLYQDLALEYAPRGLVAFAISVDDDAAAIDPFLREAKVALPVLRDPGGGVVNKALDVKVMPTTFLVDKQGRVRFTHEGFDESQLSTWLIEIEGLLAESGS